MSASAAAIVGSSLRGNLARRTIKSTPSGTLRRKSMGTKSSTTFLMLLATFGVVAMTSLAHAQEPLVKGILKTTKTRDGKAVEFPKRDPEITGVVVEFAPGSIRPRTFHPWPRYVYVISGTLTVGDDSGKDTEYPAGSMLITQNSWDIPKNLGATPVTVLVIDTAEAGTSNNVLVQEK
jgi:quercetin dioxygenase-like cupin family protein